MRRYRRNRALTVTRSVALLLLLAAPLAHADDSVPSVTPVESTVATPASTPPASAAAPVNHLVTVQPPPPTVGPELDAAIARWSNVDWAAIVRADQLLFLQIVRAKCSATIVDFTADFYKQERIRGELRGEEAAHMKWRATPFSVYMKYFMGDKGREVLYVDGENDDKVVAHPGGLLGALIKVKIEPESERAMKDNLRPITAAGMTNMMNNIVPETERARDNGDVAFQYLGVLEVGGRKAYTIKRILPQKNNYPCKELVVFIDCELLVPLGADSYDWDGQLLAKYRYTEIKLNTGLSNREFDRNNKDYGLK